MKHFETVLGSYLLSIQVITTSLFSEKPLQIKWFLKPLSIPEGSFLLLQVINNDDIPEEELMEFMLSKIQEV